MNRFARHRLLLCCLFLASLCTEAARGDATAAFDPGLLKVLSPRSIGPANMSGRIVELAVYEKYPRIMYVASASGGLWKTVNNGTTWSPVFEREATVALGAVAVFQGDPDIVWAGTGENNARNSVCWGDGVYKSIDGGKTWANMGLRDSHHIGRIVIHPTNPDIVYVAALGHLWGPNRERGLYRTMDGGKTWRQVLFINEDTGFIDLVMDPSNPKVLYAAGYQVRRDAFSGGNPATQYGPGSGLFKTSNGGDTWARLNKRETQANKRNASKEARNASGPAAGKSAGAQNGLPNRPLGRCGLSIYRKDPRVVYAVVQTDKTPTPVAGQEPNLTVRTEKDETGKAVKRPIGPDDGGIFRSDDGGQSWSYLNSLCPRPFYYGQIRVDPNDDRRIYVLGIQFHMSTDGGKTFLKGTSAKGVHPDHHALWINPADSHHLVLGCDGGVYFSYDRSTTYEHLLNLPLGQFYAVGLDMRKPYRVYGGLQDNGSWGGPSATRDPAGITIADWFRILGFDGYYCQVDPRDVDTVYAEGQYGILRRINVRTGKSTDIKPRLASGGGKDQKSNIVPAPPSLPATIQGKDTPGFRFNWSCPILLSPHNSRTVYYGGNVVFRSLDRGDHWTIVSPDLTRGPKAGFPGPSKHTGHTITTLAESPVSSGLLWAGTDDGRIHVTLDSGKQWLDLSEKVPLPPDRWITRLECSRFAEGTAYLTIDRHRNDDRAPYVFKTTDLGNSWRLLTGNLPPGGPVHVIREDPRNRNLLYVGTEFGLFISGDGGQSWHKQPHLPTVPVHDLVVHPRDRELVIGTHGRSIYIMDVAPLQELTALVMQAPAHLFDIKPAFAFRLRPLRSLGSKHYAGENPPYGAQIHYYIKEAVQEVPTLTITDVEGKKIAQVKGAQTPGLHRLTWRLSQSKAPASDFRPVAAGEYTVTLRLGQQAWSKKVQVEVEGDGE